MQMIAKLWDRLSLSFFSRREPSPQYPDIGSIRGQDTAKGAMLIAASGGHNILMSGPPGEGKSFLASTLSGILPPLTWDEYQQRKQYLGEQYVGSRLLRPFHAINPTVTMANLIGGGRKEPIPGLLPRSHCGVLFIDELPLLPSSIIEALRQPLESSYVSITRNGYTANYPCRCMLVAAYNPCPCGYRGYSKCSCTDAMVSRYNAKLSGPILDRVDIKIALAPIDNASRFNSRERIGQSVVFLRMVQRARAKQYDRQGYLNSEIPSDSVFNNNNALDFSNDGLSYFKLATDKPRYSTRGIVRIARLARTVADTVGDDLIESHHVNLACELISHN